MLSDLLQEVLPAELASQIEPDTITIDSSSYLDEEQHSHFSDIAAHLKIAGYDGEVYVLIEHKSYPDRGALLQPGHEPGSKALEADHSGVVLSWPKDETGHPLQ